ncbi:putative membrane protein YgcG [Thermocatellispora tengchongensis]|uniref:Putative membrane protein YgcG n=1 Tax=Thermocatellispora tengchongensis TaxID=1073253 RepID=A0A840P1E7_9ACTN|nr:DUF2207 domain-containing protein [Thermocatellispora tengchongensis]MBB5135084.1 putative membrane protein YgcG [Thermocatellispora tengchongensis]
MDDGDHSRRPGRRAALALMAPALGAAIALAGLAPAPAAAAAPVYTLPETVVTADVRDDGTVLVTEDHTFRFTGEGHGAYVDVPLGGDSSLSDVRVSENGTPYREEGTPELGVERPAGTYAETSCAFAFTHRIVWYFDAAPGSTRTFRVTYTLADAVEVYREHAFLHLPVWGARWQQPLDRLWVTVRVPDAGRKREGDVYAAFTETGSGLTAKVDASTRVTTAQAENVRPGTLLALDVAFPTRALDLPEEGSGDRRSDRRSDGDGDSQLQALRDGAWDDERYTRGTGGCGSAESSAESGSSDGPLLQIALVVAGLIALSFLMNRFWGSGGARPRSSYRRSHRGHGSSSWSSSGSGSSGSSDSGGGGGGGGGAW